ncbi:DUF2905 domain-containing protein [bacterium]|nr:MAG: DUF2905 domain-containing protein [bacterium]
MEGMGKLLILTGFILIILGLFLVFSGRIPYLGKLPGDIRVERENFVFYFPLATCILLSILLTLILNLVMRR